jgi:molybdopterin converting factor small subunit
MEVWVKLHYVLRAHAPGKDFKKPFAISLGEGAALSEVLTFLGLPHDRKYLLFIGTERSGPDRLLTDGDSVTILPPVIGG